MFGYVFNVFSKLLRTVGKVACLGVAMATVSLAHAERIKDLATIQGVRSNQLVGYGLVVGLDGTGDQTTQTPFTVQSLTTMLSQMGVQLPPGTSLQLKNVASVMVTATLPAFAKPGQSLDITVSSLGNAKSLRGGTLLLTPLKGADSNIYAMAQGNLIVGGVGASSGASKVQINHLSAGRIPAGATVERAVASPLNNGEFVMLELASSDFSTATRVAQAINQRMGTESAARALDGRVIQVRAPESPDARVAFIAQLEEIDVSAAQAPAKVIVNARTGSVVMNQNVRLKSSAVAHGNLSVTIQSNPSVSQPAPFGQGQTVVVDRPEIQIKEGSGTLALLPSAAQLSDVVKALNALGATPGDLVAILQALKAAGSLAAELEVI